VANGTLHCPALCVPCRVIGLDSNPAYIERAPQMARNVEFYVADISEIGNFANFCMVTDLAESSVNIAISTYWLACLAPASRSQAIANLKRLLRPGGYLYILDLVWTDANVAIHKLNQIEHWKSAIKQDVNRSAHKVRASMRECHGTGCPRFICSSN